MAIQGAFTISQFCEHHGISQGQFFKLKKAGKGPREMNIGFGERAHPLISVESAAEWRLKMEAETAAANATKARTNTANTPA